MTSRLPHSLPRMLITESGRAFRVPGRPWPRGWRRRRARNGTGLKAAMRWLPIVALPRSSKPVVGASGSTCAGLVPSSCAKPSTNWRARRFPFVSGPSAITKCNSSVAKAAMPPSVPWPSNGNASCGAVGRIAYPLLANSRSSDSPLSCSSPCDGVFTNDRDGQNQNHKLT